MISQCSFSFVWTRECQQESAILLSDRPQLLCLLQLLRTAVKCGWHCVSQASLFQQFLNSLQFTCFCCQSVKNQRSVLHVYLGGCTGQFLIDSGLQHCANLFWQWELCPLSVVCRSGHIYLWLKCMHQAHVSPSCSPTHGYKSCMSGETSWGLTRIKCFCVCLLNYTEHWWQHMRLLAKVDVVLVILWLSQNLYLVNGRAQIFFCCCS